MRSLFFLILISFLAMSSFAQQPSQKEVQAQIKQAKTEAQQMIIDLENRIAEAKKNGDDPESIQELQKQLATMKKALGIVDKAASMTEKRPKAAEGSIVTVPPYKSPYTRFYKQAVVIPTEAQAKDRLLWYKGKKINQNTLVTTRGRIIQYDRQNNRVLVQYNEKKDTPIVKLITNLARSRQWTNNLINNVAARKNSLFDYPLMMTTLKQFDLIDKAFNKLADNTIKLPSSFSHYGANISFSNNNTSGASENPGQLEQSGYDPIVEMHRELKALLDNPPPIDDFPIPPAEEFDLCYYCDATAQEKYFKDVEEWDEKFREYENKLLASYNGINHYYAINGYEAGNGANLTHADIPSLSDDMHKAYDLTFERLAQKNGILEHRYSNDVQRLTILMMCKFSLERTQALMGTASDNSLVMDFVSTTLNDFITEQKNLKNYNVIFNYAFILGIDRQLALMGSAPDDFSATFIAKVLEFNRFALTMDIEFNMVIKDAEDKDVMRATGYLTTPQKTYVSLGRNECKFQLYLYNPDYMRDLTNEPAYEINLTITEGVKLVKEGENWKSFLYSGPAEMKTVFPSIRIDFCTNGVQDSAIMDVLRFSDPDLASVTSADELSKKYTLDMQEYVNLVVASITKVESNRDGIMDITGDIIDMQSNTAVKPTGYAQLDEMQLNFNMLQQQLKIKETITLKTKENPSVVLFDAQNESSTLINKSVNMAGDRGFKIEMKKALVKLKVEHEPLQR
jgi:hypothetical protein